MNFLKKLLAPMTSKNAPVINTQPAVDTYQDEMPNNLLKDIFQDNSAPITLKEEDKNPGKLKLFLEDNYSNHGYRDGYEQHSSEFLDQKILIIKAEFRHILDENIDNRNQEVFQLKNQGIETRGLSERLMEQLELRITEIKSVISKLEKEKELSAFDEGLIMKAIHLYKDGFLKGCKDYHEAKLFAQSTGFFNN